LQTTGKRLQRNPSLSAICTVGASSWRAWVEQQVALGTAVAQISRESGLSRFAISRHSVKKECTCTPLGAVEKSSALARKRTESVELAAVDAQERMTALVEKTCTAAEVMVQRVLDGEYVSANDCKAAIAAVSQAADLHARLNNLWPARASEGAPPSQHIHLNNYTPDQLREMLAIIREARNVA